MLGSFLSPKDSLSANAADGADMPEELVLIVSGREDDGEVNEMFCKRLGVAWRQAPPIETCSMTHPDMCTGSEHYQPIIASDALRC